MFQINIVKTVKLTNKPILKNKTKFTHAGRTIRQLDRPVLRSIASQ